MRIISAVAGLWLAGLFAVNTTQAQIGASSGADNGMRNNNAPPSNFFFLHHSVGLGLINGGMRAVFDRYPDHLTIPVIPSLSRDLNMGNDAGDSSASSE